MIKHKRSFTLIELLIVIIIIGILATLGVGQYKNLAKRAMLAEAKQILSELSKAQYMFFMETGRFYNGGGETADWQDFSGLDVKPPVSKYWAYKTTHNWNSAFGGPSGAPPINIYGAVWVDPLFAIPLTSEVFYYVIVYEDGPPIDGSNGATPSGPVTMKYYYSRSDDPSRTWHEGWPE